MLSLIYGFAKRIIPKRILEARSLGLLGTVYGSTGRHEKALEYFEQSLTIRRELKDQEGVSVSLTNLGSCFRELGQYGKAIEYYQQSLVIKREIKSRGGEGSTLAELGNAYYRMGQFDKAAEILAQSLGINRQIKNRGQEASTLYHLALTERARGNLQQARGHLEECLNITDSIRYEILSPDSRAALLAEGQDVYHLYIDILMRLHKTEPARGFDALAFEASERARARGLLELLTEAGTGIREGVDASLLERERVVVSQLSAKAALLVRLLSRSQTVEQASALEKEIGQLESDYEQLQATIRRTSPRYAALTQPQPLSLAEIQKQVLDPDTLLLQYSLGSEVSYLWAVTNNSVTSYELPKSAEIERAARQVYELLTSRSRSQKGETPAQRSARLKQAEVQLTTAAQQLSQMILGPVASELGTRRLVIVADGALQYVPFAMLPVPVAARQPSAGSPQPSRDPKASTPLIVEHEIISLPSASTLAVQRRELSARKPAPNAVAILADPIFDKSDARLKTDKKGDVKAQQPPKGSQPTGEVAGTRILEYIAEGSSIIPRLRFTSREADEIMSVAPASSSMKAVGFRASRATALSPELGRYRYIHFATHGLLDSERPGLSAIVLSLVDEEGKAQDGFLRANEIYNLKLPAELVVLSACQTGLGKEIKGEGLIGLTRGFMYAGAARVVVSLWSVNDKATAELMGEFYRQMLKEGQRPAEALRSAQIKMWKQKQWQSPYYWAAFTLQGEWR